VLALIWELPGDGLSLRAPVIAPAAHVGHGGLELAQARATKSAGPSRRKVERQLGK
jgi:hypothetical protein